MIKTVAELRAALDEFPDDAQIQLAVQPHRPMQYHVDYLEEAIVDGKRVVYVVEGGLQGYLATEARQALNW